MFAFSNFFKVFHKSEFECVQSLSGVHSLSAIQSPSAVDKIKHKDKDRERKHTQNKYTSSSYNPRVVQSPCTSKGFFTIINTDYNCSRTQPRDFIYSNTQIRYFQMLNNN